MKFKFLKLWFSPRPRSGVQWLRFGVGWAGFNIALSIYMHYTSIPKLSWYKVGNVYIAAFYLLFSFVRYLVVRKRERLERVERKLDKL